MLPTVLRESVKGTIVRAMLDAVAWSGLARRLPAFRGRGIISALHHVRPERNLPFEPNMALSVTPRILADAVLASRDCGLTPVHLEDLPQLLADNAHERRFVCFTLDDGYKDNATYAAKVFSAHCVPFTVFPTTGFVERRYSMWWETAEELVRSVNHLTFDFGLGVETIATTSLGQKYAAFDSLVRYVRTANEDEAVKAIDRTARAAGIDPIAIVDREIMDLAQLRHLVENPLARLGAHTVTHTNLARASAERLAREIGESLDRIESYSGRRPTTFAYPLWLAGSRRSARSVRGGCERYLGGRHNPGRHAARGRPRTADPAQSRFLDAQLPQAPPYRGVDLGNSIPAEAGRRYAPFIATRPS